MLTTALRIVFIRTLAIVPAMAVAATPAHAAFDHLQCFKIKDSLAPATYTADIDPSDATFVAAPPGCTIKTPAKLLCVDAEKTNVVPAPPGAAAGAATQPYLCYKAKCTKVQPTTGMTDQFGVHSIQVKSTKLVCAPVPPPPTTTTVPACVDLDFDLFTDCAGDCDDTNASVNPGATELCNGFDDNCNGNTDESDPNVGSACVTGLPGVCSPGTTTCSGGSLQCIGASPSTESCDNQDNDCDGMVDEGNPGGGGACSTGLLGVCSAGTLVCSGGTFTCQQNTAASPEVCDGLDNNCNGSIDEGGACLADGAPCSANNECSSSQCVDAVCCNTACSGICQACSAAKKGSGVDGTCGNIANLTDPDSECAGSQTCDGAGACQP